MTKAKQQNYTGKSGSYQLNPECYQMTTKEQVFLHMKKGGVGNMEDKSL